MPANISYRKYVISKGANWIISIYLSNSLLYDVLTFWGIIGVVLYMNDIF